jgi:serine/threonine-protein kinase HipA
MISEREGFVHFQLPGALDLVPAALLRVQALADAMQVGRFRYGDRYLQRSGAVALD